MAQDSLSILLQENPSAFDTLSESWGAVLDNYEKSTIAGFYKNTALSGNPSNGVVHAKRFANAIIQDYGTARANRAGNEMRALDIPVFINDDKEFMSWVEEKDIAMYGVDGLIEKETSRQESGMRRYYERKFFAVGATDGDIYAPAGADIALKIEDFIQKLETVKNDFVDGVDRAEMVLVLRPSVYGQIRSQLDNASNPNISTAIGEFGSFHGVVCHSSVYLPDTVDYFIFVNGAIAQPIRQSLYAPNKVEMLDKIAFGMFLYSGTKTLAPDLVFTYGTLGTVTATSTAGTGGNTKTLVTVSSTPGEGNSFYVKLGATVAAPEYGTDVEGWTKLALADGKQEIVHGGGAKLRVAEATASGKIIKVSDSIDVVAGS